MRTSPLRRRSIRVGLVAAAAGTILTVAGCSSDDSAPKVAGDEGAGRAKPQDDNAVRKAWVDCMHKQGQAGVTQDKDGNIAFPAAKTDTGLEPGFETATKLCDEKVPGIKQAKQADNTKLVEMSRKWVECARKNGYTDMPDPDPKTAIVTVPRAVFDPTKWDAASRACDARFPMAGYSIGE